MSYQDYQYMRNVAFMKAGKPEVEKKIRRPLATSLAAFSIVVGLSACASDITKHGHVFNDEDLAQVKEGMSRDQIILALGTPDTKSTVGQNAFYYISTTTKRSAAFLSPSIVDRRVVAVYFNKKEAVERVANYGLQDGKVIDFVKRETPSKGSEDGLLKELFRNIGRPGAGVSPGGAAGGGTGGGGGGGGGY
jgi:outer membrane protein assembly factor BamE (lipoprotein component of BamABCDE complex)